MKKIISFFPSWKAHRGGWICFGLLLVLSLFGHFVHEPWYDEAQSWQIARTADWYDILFRIPHYEGHPPFWHLLLAIPAKISGLSWRWVYPLIGMICTAVSGFLIIFKAPFPRWIRYVLPFTYFLFYQYGIIVRPYSVVVLLMILLAIAFPSKDEHPGRFVGLLAALCACHLFGIAIAGGITIAWLWEIKDNRPWGVFLRGLGTDKRFHWMLGLLVWAICVLGLIIPSANSAAYRVYEGSLIANILYVLFGLPADAVLTNLYEEMFIREVHFQWSFLLATCGVGLALWIFLLGYLPRRYRKYILLSYGLMAVLMIVYCSRHHIGLFLLLAGWFAWISLQQGTYTPPAWPAIVKKSACLLLVLSLVIPLAWTVTHLCFDARERTFSGEETVRFLQEKGLLNKSVFGTWGRKQHNNGLLSENVHAQDVSMHIGLYMDKKWVTNFHMGTTKAYCGNEELDGDETTTLQAWRTHNRPDMLLGRVELEEIWPEHTDLLEQYVPIYEMHSYNMWKFGPPIKIFLPVFAHKELAILYHLPMVETHDVVMN